MKLGFFLVHRLGVGMKNSVHFQEELKKNSVKNEYYALIQNALSENNIKRE